VAKDTTRCTNCGREFSDHDYVKDSIDKYKCPAPMQSEPYYGYFVGGDPRTFHPDGEMCSEEEFANWKKACDEANRIEASRDLPCPSGWVTDDSGRAVAHILRAPFGIGSGWYEFETFFEAGDEP
jgi:hypothetical protein